MLRNSLVMSCLVASASVTRAFVPVALSRVSAAPLRAVAPMHSARRGFSVSPLRMGPEENMAEKGIVLPAVAAAAANYVPYMVTGNYVYIAGQLPMEDGEIKYKGKVPSQRTEEEAYKSARMCGLNIIAQTKAACGGDLNKVKRVVKLVGFVNSNDDFIMQPKAVNGASDLMVEVFGEIGRHARSAVGVNTLPLDVCTEVEAIIEIEEYSEFGPGFDKYGKRSTLQKGMKVEAVDRKFKDIITVATIKEITGTDVLIGFDGWGEEYDYSCKITDGDFQPPGTCMRANARMSPPNGYRGFFDWASYLEETNSEPAPPIAFTSTNVFPSFKGDVGIKFELWQRTEAMVVPLPPTPEQAERDSGQSNK
mmetsp:Transcript_4884/g.12035  ORF Transcript_4884/g.12035 Transcript_4884/m.12035 type:complete len:365 (+) Transcript_4884:1-1095(+)